jgi:hypothetical protein
LRVKGQKVSLSTHIPPGKQDSDLFTPVSQITI